MSRTKEGLVIPTVFKDGENSYRSGLQHNYYQIFRAKIKSYESVWSELVYKKASIKNGDKLSEHYHALSEHYMHLLFNQSQIQTIEESGFANNDDTFFTTHFLYSFITSATAVTEIFAWTLHDSLQLEFKKFDVTIHHRDSKDALGPKGQKFKDTISNTSEKLSQVIYSAETQSVLKNLQIHRDVILHQGTIHLMPHEDRNQYKREILKPIHPQDFREGFDTGRPGKGFKELFELPSKFVNTTLKTIDDVSGEINLFVENQIKSGA